MVREAWRQEREERFFGLRAAGAAWNADADSPGNARFEPLNLGASELPDFLLKNRRARAQENALRSHTSCGLGAWSAGRVRRFLAR
jgi:hypothetical protein